LTSKRAVEAVALIADPHYHDVDHRPGVGRGRGVAFRTLADTAESTRVFNESFAALPALLDDIAARGIRLVAVLGDLTDDGQAATMANAVALLARYRERHGLRFFACAGNHDLYAIDGRHQSKRFLDPDGGHTLVTSDPDATAGASTARIVTPEMHCGGYESALTAMADLGFFRRPDHLHWESPFGENDALAARTFAIRSADGGTTRRMIDASYLVEPVPGLWLLSIDANVFEPKNGDRDPAAEASYIDSTDAGWNAVVRLKPFLLAWMADVSARARAEGKRLLTFSHYPCLDLLGATHADEVSLFGETGLVRRAPTAATARAVAATGVGVHFSGHLHVNDTTLWQDGGRHLVNVGVPSTVAFPPGYKIATFDGGALDIVTVPLDRAAGHDRAFAAYRAELARSGGGHGDLADARSLRDFLGGHVAALVADRYLPREWPAAMAAEARRLDIADLAARAGVGGIEPLPVLALVEDWYRLRKGRDLARIPPARLATWRALAAAYGARAWAEGSVEAWIAGFLRMLEGYLGGEPSHDFRIDLATGTVSAAGPSAARPEARGSAAPPLPSRR
jgi:3',5'-cyclic AMP phosphodiesterase CpdA